MKFKQIVSANWRGNQDLTYTIFALGEDGNVYRYGAKDDKFTEIGTGRQKSKRDSSSTYDRQRREEYF